MSLPDTAKPLSNSPINNKPLLVKAFIIIILLCLLFMGPFSLVTGIKTWKSYSSASDDVASKKAEIATHQKSLAAKAAELSKVTGSTMNTNKDFIYKAISAVEGCKVLSINGYRDGTPAITKIQDMSAATGYTGFEYSLMCANPNQSIKILDGYNFLYDSFNVTYDSGAVLLRIRTKGD